MNNMDVMPTYDMFAQAYQTLKMYVKLYLGPRGAAILFDASIVLFENFVWNKFTLIRGECCVFTA